MNNYELKNEAKAYAFNHYGDIDLKGDCLADDVIMERAYLAAAEPREEKIAELKKQIEKMKCCGNCENRCGQEECANCHNYSKWKFKQAEQFYEEIIE